MIYYDNIMKRAKEKQIKEGVSYPEKDGKLYSTFRIFYILSVIYQSFWSLIVVSIPLILWGEWEILDGAFNIGNSLIYLKHYIPITVSFCLLILSLFALKFNQKIVGASIFGILNSSIVTMLIFVFKDFYRNDSVTGSEPAIYYYGYLVPLLIALVCIIGMVGIVINAYIKTKKAYNRVLELVYDTYNELPENDKPEWEDYVKNYEF